MAVPQGCNLCWSLDFMADTLVSDHRFRILTLVDDFTRECLGLVADTSLTVSLPELSNCAPKSLDCPARKYRRGRKNCVCL